MLDVIFQHTYTTFISDAVVVTVIATTRYKEV